jgi:hypothetical protein
VAIDAKRRLIPEIDFGGKGLEPVASRSPVIHASSCSPRAGPGRPSPGALAPVPELRLPAGVSNFGCAGILTRINLSNTPPSWHQDDATLLP